MVHSGIGLSYINLDIYFAIYSYITPVQNVPPALRLFCLFRGEGGYKGRQSVTP